MFQSSAKNNTNINEPFDYIIKEVLKIKKNHGNSIKISDISKNKNSYCNC